MGDMADFLLEQAIFKDEYDGPDEFLWQTQDGQLLSPSEMKTTHLFYSLRMLYNHLCPPALRIPGCKRYSGIELWSKDDLKAAVWHLSHELATRADIPAWMAAQIEQMRSNISDFRTKKIQ